MIDTPIGKALPTNHCRDRIERHAISTEYVEELLEDAEFTDRDDGRTIATAERDGVEWEVILEVEDNGRLDHEWDVITVVPSEVDLEAAEESGSFDSAEALNLALYSD